MTPQQTIEQAIEALEEMKAEFRGYDLPYGSKAYTKANESSNNLRALLEDMKKQEQLTQREGWQLLEECRSSVKFDLQRYERMILDYRRLGPEGKDKLAVCEAEENRLQALLDKIDAAPKPTEDE